MPVLSPISTTLSAARRLLVPALALAALSSAWAGRPLAVDDANTNDAGHGHVEAWATRVPGLTVLTVAPAYAPIDGLEFGAAYARENGSGVHATTLQLKWRITASRDDGCNLGLSLGGSRLSHGGGRVGFANLLGSCNGVAGGSVHLNLGQAKASGESATGS